MTRAEFLRLFALPFSAIGVMGQMRRIRGTGQTSPGAGKPGDGVLASFSGVLRELESRSLILDQPDENMLKFIRSKKTKFYDESKQIKPSALKPGDRITVEAKEAIDGELEAVNVHIEHEKPADPSPTAAP
jgi:hypothetical protein